MVVALVLAAVALVLVMIAWGSIMDLGVDGSHGPGSKSHATRHAA